MINKSTYISRDCLLLITIWLRTELRFLHCVVKLKHFLHMLQGLETHGFTPFMTHCLWKAESVIELCKSNKCKYRDQNPIWLYYTVPLLLVITAPLHFGDFPIWCNYFRFIARALCNTNCYSSKLLFWYELSWETKQKIKQLGTSKS